MISTIEPFTSEDIKIDEDILKKELLESASRHLLSTDGIDIQSFLPEDIEEAHNQAMIALQQALPPDNMPHLIEEDDSDTQKCVRIFCLFYRVYKT